MRFRVVVRGLLALCLLVGAGCSFIPNYLAPAEFRAASFVPGDTWLFSQVTLRPGLPQLANANRLGDAFTSQPGWDGFVRTLNSTAGQRDGNFATDILNLLDGEVAIAAAGDLTPSTGIPKTVLLAHSSDPDRLVALLLSSTTGAPPQPRDTQGARIYRAPGNVGLATFRGWMVVASTSDVLDDTLGRIGDGSAPGALMDKPEFKALLPRLPSERMAMEYLDVGLLVRQGLLRGFPGAQMQLPPETFGLLRDIDSQVMMSVAAVGAGLDIHIEGASRLPPELMAQQRIAADVGDASSAFAHLPSDTLLAYGGGLPPLGPEFDAAVSQAFQLAAEQVRLPELANLDLHLGQWLGGSFALGGSPGTTGLPNGQPDLFLVAEVTDPRAARLDLAGVSRVLPPKAVTPVTISGFPFLEAVATNSQAVTYGVANDWLYVVRGDATQIVAAASSGGLEGNERYAALRSALGDDPVNVFVDIQGIADLSTDLLDRQARTIYQSTVDPLVRPLTFFGGGGRSDPNGDAHAHFLLGIQHP